MRTSRSCCRARRRCGGSRSAPARRSTSASTTAAARADGVRPSDVLADEVALAAGATLSHRAPAAARSRSRAHDVAQRLAARSTARSRTAAARSRRAARCTSRATTRRARARRSRSTCAAPRDGDSLRVEGAAALAGTLAVHDRRTRPRRRRRRSCSPRTAKPTGDVREGARTAPGGPRLDAGLRRNGRHARRRRAAGAAPASLARPVAAPAVSRRRRSHALPARQVDGRARR